MMQNPECILREASIEDVNEIENIEKTSFTHSMSRNLLFSEINKDSAKTFVLSLNSKIIAYAIIDIVLDEVSLLHIAVDKDYRNMGAGSKLLEYIIEYISKMNATFITLEVRKSNVPAISLYKKYGFVEMGVRKNYYKIPNEDALIMTRNFEEKNENISDRKQL